AEDARFQQEVAQYQNTVLVAHREAEDAIVGFLRAQEQALSLRQATNAALESRDLIQELYRGGNADFGRVFVAELVLAQQQDALAVAEGSIATNLVAIYRALGGGWQIRLNCQQPPMAFSGAVEVPAPQPDQQPGQSQPIHPLPGQLLPGLSQPGE